MDSVSGSCEAEETLVSGTSGIGGDSLFSFDPLDAMSRRRRNKKLEKMECWPQVKHMLDNGMPITQIVHYIQGTRKEYTHVKPGTLRTMINQWLGNLANRNRLIDHRIPVRHLNLINSNQDRVDPIDAMNMLFAIQMDRVLFTYEKERASGKINRENNPAIKLALEMIKSLSDMMGEGVRQQGLGKSTTGTAPEQRIDGTLAQMDRMKKMFEERWGSTAANVLMDPESRNKLFNAISKIRKTSSVSMSQLIRQNTEQAESMDGTNQEIIEVSGDDDSGQVLDTEFTDQG